MKELFTISVLAVGVILASLSAHAVENMPTTDYETVAASQSDQVLGPVGGAGDVLERVIIIPATTGAGSVSIKDGSGSSISLFVSGTLSDLKPIIIPLGVRSTSGGWKLTTGANVSAIGVGRFK